MKLTVFSNKIKSKLFALRRYVMTTLDSIMGNERQLIFKMQNNKLLVETHGPYTDRLAVMLDKKGLSDPSMLTLIKNNPCLGSLSEVIQCIENNYRLYYVADNNTVIFSVWVIKITDDKYKWYINFSCNDFTIMKLHVDARWRGMGLAKNLLTNVLVTEFRDGGDCLIDCNFRNISSRKVIEKIGLSLIKTTKTVYKF